MNGKGVYRTAPATPDLLIGRINSELEKAFFFVNGIGIDGKHLNFDNIKSVEDFVNHILNPMLSFSSF